MLTVDPRKRITAKDALDHPWFDLFNGMPLLMRNVSKVDSEVIANLQNFQGESILKKAALNLLVMISDTSELKKLEREFRKVDENGGGLVNEHSLHQVLKTAGI